MTSIIEEIKAKVDVVEEIGLVVALQKSGKALKGLCPFHNERTPSFYVFPETQNWHCFGCHEGGDVFTFVEKQQGLEFADALRYLAEKANVALDEHGARDPEEERAAHALKERMRTLNETAMLWFHQALLRSKEGAEARVYAQSRGISTETVLAFSLGYAPDHWDALSRYLHGQGFTERELVVAGLARERELGKGGGVYDYFRRRLIFPIRDTRGRVIGFGGRAFGDDQPKYLNSPQTALFEKNSVLYAMDMARDAIKQANQVVIVEGYVDAVIAHQYGTRQTVACIGSAITEKHIAQLKKLTRQVTLALDPDAAGAAATEHGIQEALKTFDRTVVPVPIATGAGSGGKYRSMIRLEEQVDAEINVLQLPPGEDPDELIRRDFSQWSYAVSHPLPLIDYYFIVKTADLNVREPRGKSEAAKRLLPVIGTISDRLKRDAYIRKLAAMISIDERSLSEELQHVVANQKTSAAIAVFTAPAAKQYKQPPSRTWTPEQEGAARGVVDGASAETSEASERSGFAALDKRRADKLQWEDYLIGLLLQNPELSPHVCGIITDGDFAGTDTRELYHILNSIDTRGSSSSNQPLEYFVPGALQTTIARVRQYAESRSPKDRAGQIKDAIQCATRLKRTRLVQLNIELKFLLDEATQTHDVNGMQQLKSQLADIYRQLRTIDSATHLQG